MLAKDDKIGVDEPDWNWRLAVAQSECKTKFTYRVVCILNKNRHSTYIISNLVTFRFTLSNFQILCLPEQELQINPHKSKVEWTWTALQSLNYSAGDSRGSPSKTSGYHLRKEKSLLPKCGEGWGTHQVEPASFAGATWLSILLILILCVAPARFLNRDKKSGGRVKQVQ